jgi:acyl-CoA synthetase (AMP-forming)/AMP-acid ligase II/thioesterase domain-containing protein/acyl carrier protein
MVGNFDEVNAQLGTLHHACILLNNPAILAREKHEVALEKKFPKIAKYVESPKVIIIEDLHQEQVTADEEPHSEANLNDLALFMLTSGSTGNAKIVMLTHGNLLASISGKASEFKLGANDATLNWIALDHVAGLVDCHMLALSVGGHQLQLNSGIVLANPISLLQLIAKYQVSLTFAPNFLFRKLIERIHAEHHIGLDVSCLRVLISGGESVVVKTALEFIKAASKFNLNPSCITPGFGMTETCAGCVFNRNFPAVDGDSEFASLGSTIEGVQIRIMDENDSELPQGEQGNLQVFGGPVLQSYYKNPSANSESFDADGWFFTGDRAMIDPKRGLVLTGRSKDSIIINGVNYYSHEIETTIEELDFIDSSWTVACPTRKRGSDTEGLLILCHLKTRENILDLLADIRGEMLKQYGVRPAYVVPLEKEQIPKSSLGKISRTQMRTAFERGDFAGEVESLAQLERDAVHFVEPANDAERDIRSFFGTALLLEANEISTNQNFFDLGGTSVTLIGLKVAIDARFKIDLPIVSVFQNPTVQQLAAFVQSAASKPPTYNPIVPLQLTAPDNRDPFFMVHPGVGDVLIFVELAKLFKNYRKFYALRARGFNEGEEYFQSFHEMVECYTEHILTVQSSGRFYLSGYSYGGAVAAEIAKSLERRGHEVAFVGLLNIPPNSADRMHEINDFDGLMNLVLFVDLLTPTEFERVREEVRGMPKQQQLDTIIQRSNAKRVQELAITAQKLDEWVALARSLIECGKGFDPNATGKLRCTPIVFWARPLFDSVEVWLKRLSAWQDFTDGEVRFIEVPGEHYTLMSPRLVRNFAKIFKQYMGE